MTISNNMVGRKWKRFNLFRDRKLYHPNNAALGMAAMRAGVNHWQAGLIEVGHGMVCKAYAILLVTHGPTHPITKDLEVNDSLNIRSLHGSNSRCRCHIWCKTCEHVASEPQ